MLSCNNTAKKRAGRLSDSICNLWEMGNQGAIVGRLSGGKCCLEFIPVCQHLHCTRTTLAQSHQFLQQVMQMTSWKEGPTIPQHQPTKRWLGRDTKSAAHGSPSSCLVPGWHFKSCGCCPCIFPSCGTYRMAPGDCWALEKHRDMWFVWWGSNKTPSWAAQQDSLLTA